MDDYLIVGGLRRSSDVLATTWPAGFTATP